MSCPLPEEESLSNNVPERLGGDKWILEGPKLVPKMWARFRPLVEKKKAGTISGALFGHLIWAPGYGFGVGNVHA